MQTTPQHAQNMLDFLRSEGLSERLIGEIEAFRREYPVTGDGRRFYDS